MSVICVTWETIHLHGEAWVSHHRLRHQLFVERLQWDVESYNGLEYDQFDTPAAKYLLWLDRDNRARAATRLIPTTESYMVKRLWPDWIQGELPSSPSVWEASRFGCDRNLAPPVRREVIGELICACQEYGIRHGVKRYLGVMPIFVFKRVIAAAGCPVELLTTPRTFDRHATAAAYIHVSREALARVRAKAGVTRSILDSRRNIGASAG